MAFRLSIPGVGATRIILLETLRLLHVLVCVFALAANVLIIWGMSTTYAKVTNDEARVNICFTLIRHTLYGVLCVLLGASDFNLAHAFMVQWISFIDKETEPSWLWTGSGQIVLGALMESYDTIVFSMTAFGRRLYLWPCATGFFLMAVGGVHVVVGALDHFRLTELRDSRTRYWERCLMPAALAAGKAEREAAEA
ncbi:uncharacterized protein VTP21DRAFT_3801 [Calcarisporiella thermophila]|uniref:uncharacterized protein n=1 Tax=Calcarisporiella thermophila TaxID=911321 RepID=UPI0037431B37